MLRRHIGEARGDQGGDLRGRGGADEGERLGHGADHRHQLRALGGDAGLGRIEGGIGGQAAIGLGVPDRATGIFHLAGEGLEHLRHIQRAGGQRGGILRHGLAGHGADRPLVDAGANEIALQAPGRRWHLGDQPQPQPGQVLQHEARPRRGAEQQEGVAHHHGAEAAEGAARVLAAQQQRPHRPGPGEVGLAGQQLRRRRVGGAGGDQPQVDALPGEAATRLGEVEGRIEQRAERFEQGHRTHGALLGWMRHYGRDTARAKLGQSGANPCIRASPAAAWRL